MAVYVDQLRPCVRTKTWRWPESCHLLADSVEELHSFAANIGLKREWFQAKASFPHYDLTRGMRAKAVKNGAREFTGEDFVRWKQQLSR